ncbi:MAG: hypothetical protein B6U97_01785 [Candidatus Altiarchaeales archaeon ex4484_96]|nr:MAG: hypothetical protein B6U97_01785 [Candidatus Altiarchaeales archaeon ex4484_96]
MTYGWAILVILIVVAVLWQWGLFNPSGSVKSGQSGFWGVVPYDYKYTPNGIFSIELQNNIDDTVTIESIKVSTSTKSNSWSGEENISAGSLSPVFNINNLDPYNGGSSYEVFVVIEYNDSRVNTSLLSSGRIWGSVG